MAQQNVAQHMASAQAAAAYDQASKNVGFFGRLWLKLFGCGSIASGIGPGMQVFVQLEGGGPRLPCTVGQVLEGQLCITVHDGRQMWVKPDALSKTP